MLPLHSPSPGQPNPLLPLRILLLPYPLRRTSGRRLSWHTSDQTCGQDEPRPQQWRWCCSTCKLHAEPWPDHLKCQSISAQMMLFERYANRFTVCTTQNTKKFYKPPGTTVGGW